MHEETWAIVAATFLGPIAAILVSLWRERRSRVRERRMWIFRTLMATRRVAIREEHVSAINQIEVEFYEDRGVMAAWKNYVGHLNSYPRQENVTDQERLEWERRRNGLLAVLLAAIGKRLGFAIGEVEIQEGGYAPEAWQARELAALNALNFLVDLSEGRKVLPIFAVPPPAPGPVAPQGR